jgi:hypothetical protein
MKYLKYSGYYIITYAGISAVMFTFWPKFFLHLLFSNVAYTDYTPWRLVGSVCSLVFVLVLQIIRIESVEMFKATVVAQSTAFPIVVSLYFVSHDKAYLSFAAVMGFGILTTLVAFYLRAKHHA